jgi:hypothetical protein
LADQQENLALHIRRVLLSLRNARSASAENSGARVQLRSAIGWDIASRRTGSKCNLSTGCNRVSVDPSSTVHLHRSCEQVGSDRLEVRLLPHAGTKPFRPRLGELGRALLPEDGAFGTVADIYIDRCKDLVKGRLWAYEIVLGHVLAHELGHLLLGHEGHQTVGIMRSPWDKQDVNKALQRRLVFTSRQASKMREEVLARLLCRRAPS